MIYINSRADIDQWVDDQGYWTLAGDANGSTDPDEIAARQRVVAHISDLAHDSGLRYGDDWAGCFASLNADELMAVAGGEK